MNEKGETEELSVERPDPREPDWFLQVLVDLANNKGVTFSITLLTHGLLVSGTLVGGAKYFEGFGNEFASGFSDAESADAVRASFAQYGDIYARKDDDSPTSGENPMYIHLMDARFFNPGGRPIPGNRGVWWRGRLSEVSGFMVGVLEPAPA
jgi:hypothetical protein